MKKIFLILATCFFLQQTQAQNAWQGSWETQQGDVEIIFNKGYVYGLYANVGWVYGKVAPGNKRVVGTFWNEAQKKSGRFEWNLNTAGTGFTGKWAWGEDFKTLEQLNGGNWNGTKVNSKSNAKPWTKTYTTNAGQLTIIHMGGKRALGLIDNVVFSGHAVNNNLLVGVMHTLDVIGKRKQYGTSFSINQANNNLSGYWFKPSGKENLTGILKGSSAPANNSASASSSPKEAYKIRITFNTFKLNKARRGNTQKARIAYQTIPEKKSDKITFKSSSPNYKEFEPINYNDDLYYQFKLPIFGEKDFKVGVEEKIKNYYDFKIDMTFKEMSDAKLKFNNIIDLNILALKVANQHDWLVRSINIVEIIQYLTKQVNASDFPDAVHGRKRLSNTTDTFWLEEYAGKRKARGYGDLIFDNGIRFGYSYTLELIN